MRYLLDTNVLLRFALPNEPEHGLVAAAVKTILSKGHTVHFSPQGIREMWHVCTRSQAANGIGLSPAQVLSIVSELRHDLIFLDDEPGTFDIWLSLVSSLSISGAKAHDANHAAFAQRHGIDCVLTFDSSDFNRFRLAGIKTLSPGQVLP